MVDLVRKAFGTPMFSQRLDRGYYRMAFPPAKWKRRQYCELYLDVVPNGNLVRKYET
jgi:hypothetical protein